MPEDHGETAMANDPGMTLVRAARDALQTAPERNAIEYRRRWYRFGELKAVADQLAELIGSSGADPDAPIAFAPRNRPSAVAALLALIAQARTVRMVYAFQSGSSLARNLGRVNAPILIAAAEDFSPEVIEQLRQDGSAGIALTEMGAEFVAGLERCAHEPGAGPRKQSCLEILTSGTTGPAKMWPLSYEMLEKRFVLANVAYSKEVHTDTAPTLVIYSLANTSGLYSVLPTIFAGLPIVLHEKFDLHEWHDFVLRYRPSEIFLPVAGMQMALDAEIPPEDLACAKFLRSGMTGLPIELQRNFEERYRIPVMLSYGATEFGGVVISMNEELLKEWGQKKTGSTGRAVPGVKIRVVDEQSGRVLPPGKEGLLEVLVPTVSPDWSRTSDLAVIDEDEFVFIKGRADGAIMRGGFKLLPETIEAALLRHPDVGGAAVIGVKDRRLGEVPAAIIETRKGANRPLPAELDQHLREHVPSTHIPVIWRFVSELPRTSSFKVERHKLKDMLAEESRIV